MYYYPNKSLIHLMTIMPDPYTIRELVSSLFLRSCPASGTNRTNGAMTQLMLELISDAFLYCSESTLEKCCLKIID